MVVGGSNVDGFGWKCLCEFTKCHRLFGWMSRVIQKHLLKMRHPSLYKTKCLWAFSALVKTIVPRRQHHRTNMSPKVNMWSVLEIGVMYIFNVYIVDVRSDRYETEIYANIWCKMQITENYRKVHKYHILFWPWPLTLDYMLVFGTCTFHQDSK